MQSNVITEVLARPLSQELLARDLTRLAYVAKDGTPRSIPIAFTSDRSGTPQIYVGNVNGGGAKRITYQGSYNTAPAFSPDCKKIAYESREGGIFQIYVIDAGGGDPKELTQSGSNESPVWSPDGRYIIYASKSGGSSRLYILRAEDGSVGGPIMEGEGNDSNPTWSGWMGE